MAVSADLIRGRVFIALGVWSKQGHWFGGGFSIVAYLHHLIRSLVNIVPVKSWTTP